MRFFTVPKVSDARSSAGWALVFIALLYLTAPAVGAMGRVNLIDTVYPQGTTTIKASDLLTHASDVDSSDVLHVTNLQATHGSLTDNKDGTYTFTPDKDFNGEIRLTYDVVDGHGGSVSTQAKFDLTATPDNAIITDAQTNADLRGVTEDRQ